ncbi:MAG: single-stranded DNA-binding protein [Bacilli bacterium]|nr:single-stranded DNA-binding protein [Bacilli bacterium]
MLNHVILIGRLTRDPELRKTTSGLSVASFTVAVDDTYSRGPNGEKNTLFMGCSIFGNKADNVAKFVRKGSLVAVSGRLNQRKYTNKDNVQVTVIETIADNVDFLEPKGQSAAGPEDNFRQVAPQQTYSQVDTAASSNLDGLDVVDDDLPF